MNSEQQVLWRSRIPQRSCVACRETKAKRDLIRLVSSAGIVEVDSRGKRAGRGAYLCPTPECWERGLKGNRLEHALRSKLTPENHRALVEYGRSLPQKGGDGR